MKERALISGEILFAEGDEADNVYIVKSGKLKVVKTLEDGNAHNIAQVGTGGIVGEMALVDGKPRAATVVALEECAVLEVSNAEFTERIAKSDKVVGMLLKVFTDRIRQQAETIIKLSG